MKLAIIGPMKRTYEVLRLMEEAKKFFSTVSYFEIPSLVVKLSETPDVIYKGKSLLDYDAVLPRIPRTYLHLGSNILEVLKEAGMPLPYEPESLLFCHHKFLTLLMLKRYNLPVPETVLALNRKPIEKKLKDFGFPVVIKLAYGSRGVGVMFADSEASARSILDVISEELNTGGILLERYLPGGESDIRVYVVGGKIAGVMKRIAAEGERRANIGAGGKGVAWQINPVQERIALSAAAALKLKVGGVDLIETKEGTYVIEVNVNAQFKGLETATGRNIAGEIVKFIYETVS